MKVLVTGASGFIGTRLVERLAELRISVRAIVRRGLVGRPNTNGFVERIRGDVTKLDGLREATVGCKVVYHCAWGGTTFQEQRLVNVEGTRNVIKAAAEVGVRRVVHLSSVAVHGQNLPEVLTEEFPLVTDGDPYSVTKAEGERTAFDLGASSGVEVVALRPTLVYGPRAPLWLVGYFERVSLEQVSLINNGRGRANLIHIDDLVNAMLAVADKDGIGGEAFLMNGEGSTTWRDYLGYFAAMCGKPLPPSKRAWLARLSLPVAKAYSILTNRAPHLLPMDVHLMSQSCSVSIQKAKRVLGYEPKIPIEEGMAQCERWLLQQGYLPPTPRHARPVAPLKNI